MTKIKGIFAASISLLDENLVLDSKKQYYMQKI